ncbi:MAG: O-acetyl-ADP-ribose deacetylase [Spirochaetota bacterium]
MAFSKKLLDHIHVVQGDITTLKVDAVVNAANTSLLGGGGVDGAIHRAAGEGLLEECKTLNGARPGEAKITGGYNLPAKHVIHTPGPVYKNGSSGEEKTLGNSYYNSMMRAKENNLSSIAFPAVSTGVYGYPKEDACRVAVKTIIDFMDKEEYHIDVYFVLFDTENYAIYKNYIKELNDELS